MLLQVGLCRSHCHTSAPRLPLGLCPQICRLRGYSPIVAVVGGAHKVASARALGADVVVDKAACASPAGLWRAIEQASPAGFAAIFDANGVETLQVRLRCVG